MGTERKPKFLKPAPWRLGDPASRNPAPPRPGRRAYAPPLRAGFPERREGISKEVGASRAGLELDRTDP